MEPHLDDAVRFTRGLHHGLAFIDGVADGFFDVDVRAGFDGVEGRHGMPVVGCGYDRDIGALLAKHLAVILIAARLVRGEFRYLGSSLVHLVGVGIGERDGGTVAGRKSFAQDVHSPPAGADEGGPILLTWLRGEQGSGREGGLEKDAAIHSRVSYRKRKAGEERQVKSQKSKVK